jgi:hypothetical protein
VGLLLLFNLFFTNGFASVDNLRPQLIQAVPVVIVRWAWRWSSRRRASTSPWAR